MMKKTLTALPLIAAMAFGANATEFNPYVSLRLGGGILTSPDLDGSDPLGAFGIAGGASFEIAHNINMRLEGEIASAVATHEERIGSVTFEDEMSFMTFMANVYFDFMTDARVRPYAGFGLGMASVNWKETMRTPGGRISIEDSDGGMAFGLYAGLGFNLTSSGYTQGDVGIRHVRTDAFNVTWEMTTVNFGVRFMF